MRCTFSRFARRHSKRTWGKIKFYCQNMGHICMLLFFSMVSSIASKYATFSLLLHHPAASLSKTTES